MAVSRRRRWRWLIAPLVGCLVVLPAMAWSIWYLVEWRHLDQVRRTVGIVPAFAEEDPSTDGQFWCAVDTLFEFPLENQYANWDECTRGTSTVVRLLKHLTAIRESHEVDPWARSPDSGDAVWSAMARDLAEIAPALDQVARYVRDHRDNDPAGQDGTAAGLRLRSFFRYDALARVQVVAELIELRSAVLARAGDQAGSQAQVLAIQDLAWAVLDRGIVSYWREPAQLHRTAMSAQSRLWRFHPEFPKSEALIQGWGAVRHEEARIRMARDSIVILAHLDDLTIQPTLHETVSMTEETAFSHWRLLSSQWTSCLSVIGIGRPHWLWNQAEALRLWNERMVAGFRVESQDLRDRGDVARYFARFWWDANQIRADLARFQDQNDLMRTAIAVYRFREIHHRLPERLEELVPGFLHQLGNSITMLQPDVLVLASDEQSRWQIGRASDERGEGP